MAFLLTGQSFAQKKILFDNTKAESCGNGDWVVDADLHDLYFSNSGGITNTGSQSDAQRYPTPAQSTITSLTPENYWTGAISAWGIECVKSGLAVESLPYNVAMIYGTGGAQDLSNYKVFVIDEPNIQFTAAQKTAIVNFVYNGGGLFIISDHTNSDRNFDGWDSPAIWNDLFTTNSVHNNPFGISFDLDDFSGSYGIPNVSGDSCLNGPYGTASQVKWSGGTSMTLSTSANPTVKADVYKTGGSGSTGVLFAHGYYGKGRFAAMGDSSPTDDATGDPGDQLYNGWTTDANGNHKKLIMNATMWLAGQETVSGIDDPFADAGLQLYPNPADNIVKVQAPELCTLQIFDMSGRACIEAQIDAADGKSIDISILSAGVYIYTISGADGFHSGRFVKK
ncbi:MAG: T9SS type A sorting domain-containing protein [Bacteroidetes bacterium]|nr:T9SS type A sorting domain-containing protein [Bacteroidota bacterium]